ncbi:MAG: hypothetical protein KAJ24_05855 [Candidatus Aenigmarchaeota archaeon]|nr:hypothetical protein [Candidatus Aenigmarchaeota archaeon]
MDSTSRLYLERAQNELNLAKVLFTLSGDADTKVKIFAIPETETFLSAVITHAYYSIFYGAKAYLAKKGITTKPPEEHKKTYEELKKLVDEGVLDVELLMIYEEVVIRADLLIGIFKIERKKRGNFTYRTLPQANIEPANKSLENAKLFFKHIYNLCD